MTSLWDRIYRIANAEFPDLGMKPPKAKGSNSNWVIFKADLAPRVTIDWKISKATVELSFWKGASPAPARAPDFSDLDGYGAGRPSFQTVGETKTIRVPLSRPPPDFVTIGEDLIREALRAAQGLHRFYREHAESFG